MANYVSSDTNLNLEFIMCFLLVFITTTSTTAPAASAIVPGYTWSANTFDFLMLLLYLLCICFWIRVQPGLAVFQGIHNFFLLIVIHFLAQTFVFTRTLGCRAHGMNVTIK